MKTGKAVLGVLTGAVVVGLFAIYAGSFNRNTSEQRNGADSSTGSASTSVTRMEKPARSAQEMEAVAAAHVNAIRETAKKADANTRAALEASQADQATSASELAEKQATELEKSLLDSISSLTQQLINEPGLTTNAISMLQGEENPETMLMIAQAIGEAAAKLGDRFPYDLLLKMAESDPSLQRRYAALVALGYVSKISPELQERIAELSRTGPTVDIRMAAINAMGSWMSRNRQLTQEISEALLPSREASDDPMIRGLVIQTIGNMDTPLTPKILEAMKHAVVHESEAANRSLAAVALGSGAGPGNRAEILTALEQAYLSEPNVETQRHIITQIAKAARQDAESYLKRLPTPDPLLAQDVTDWVEIMASAPSNDWGAMWNQKSDRDGRRGTYPGGSGGHGPE